MNRILEKMGSVRAVCLLAMTVTLCVLAWRAPDTWQKVFEAALMFLLGNYVGRNDRKAPANAANPQATP